MTDRTKLLVDDENGKIYTCSFVIVPATLTNPEYRLYGYGPTRRKAKQDLLHKVKRVNHRLNLHCKHVELWLRRSFRTKEGRR